MSTIFDFTTKDWEYRTVPSFFRDSIFFAFLFKIVRTDAAKVISFTVSAEDIDALANQLALIAEMGKLYMPGLRELDINIWKKKVLWDESPDFAIRTAALCSGLMVSSTP